MTNPKAAVASDLACYTRAAQRSSARVIREYSTSFHLATRLLDKPLRCHVENLFGLVRVADEIVDGAAFEAGLDLVAQRGALDALEAETIRALDSGYSTNLIVHSFAVTSRAAGIGTELTEPFFASMRRDLSPDEFTPDEVRDYIYGSAEVVGLMCLCVFLADCPPEDDVRRRLELGARRLGAAFQKINFLRDLSTDWERLGRNYFPGTTPGNLTEHRKRDLVADIDADLSAADAVIPELPRGCRTAVSAAHGLFSALNQRLRSTPAAELMHARNRVPNPAKFAILVRAKVGRPVRRRA
ncbi:MAG: squalene/phytoene synthase family protein [Microbacteriaceae bacterium]